MSLYTPTVWVDGETPRSAALFNKREQGIANLFKKRAYWNAGTGYVIDGDNTYKSLYFGTQNNGWLYDTDGTAYANCVSSSGGKDVTVYKPAWATIGIFSVRIDPYNWDWIQFYAVAAGIYGYAHATNKKVIKIDGITTSNLSVSVACQKNYGAATNYNASLSVAWY